MSKIRENASNNPSIRGAICVSTKQDPMKLQVSNSRAKTSHTAPSSWYLLSIS